MLQHDQQLCKEGGVNLVFPQAAVQEEVERATAGDHGADAFAEALTEAGGFDLGGVQFQGPAFEFGGERPGAIGIVALGFRERGRADLAEGDGGTVSRRPVGTDLGVGRGEAILIARAAGGRHQQDAEVDWEEGQSFARVAAQGAGERAVEGQAIEAVPVDVKLQAINRLGGDGAAERRLWAEPFGAAAGQALPAARGQKVAGAVEHAPAAGDIGLAVAIDVEGQADRAVDPDLVAGPEALGAGVDRVGVSRNRIRRQQDGLGELAPQLQGAAVTEDGHRSASEGGGGLAADLELHGHADHFAGADAQLGGGQQHGAGDGFVVGRVEHNRE